MNSNSRIPHGSISDTWRFLLGYLNRFSGL